MNASSSAAGARAIVSGPCITFGDNVNTDVIIPGRYLVSIDPAELATHAFEPLGPDVQQRLMASKIIVAGRNFGCGSAREQAATCLIGVGIKAVVAASFARVFFRNAINTGLIAIECPDLVAEVHDGDVVEVDYERGAARTGETEHPFTPFPEGLKAILEAGGLLPYLEATAGGS